MERGRFLFNREFTGTFIRKVALGGQDLSLFRIGHPLIDFASNQSLCKGRGRTYAMWRMIPEWPTDSGAEWVGFRFEFVIEGDLERLVAAFVERSYPFQESLLRRTLDSSFPPGVRYSYFRCDGAKVPPGVPLFQKLDQPKVHD